MRFNQTHIRWNTVARAQHHDIARHQFGGRNRFMAAVTNDLRVAGEHIANAFQRLFCIAFLNVTNQGIDHRDAENNKSINRVAHHGGQRRRGQQDVDQDIIKMGEEAQPRRLAFFLRQRIRPPGVQAIRGICPAQPFWLAVELG